MVEDKKNWDLVIEPKKHLLDLRLKQILEYWDLLILLVKKDIVVVYKQTILGPIWFFIQPIMTTLIFTFVFGNIADIPTDGIPKPLFYMCGIVIWNYFSECFMKTSDTFTSNAGVFGKVYYPRLINPLSVVISNGIKFLIQFFLFLVMFFYFLFQTDNILPQIELFFFPLFLIIMALLGLGMGLIFSALTTKYKDLKFLLQFGVQLLMYASPIIYPLSTLEGNLKNLVQLNPITHVIEGCKYAFLGQGSFTYYGLIYAIIFSIIVLIFGIVIFNRTERNFMDTV
jgi:lipopolysaccharide transport system permease protein